MTDGDDHTVSPSAAALAIPQFTFEDLRERLGSVLRRDAAAVVYSLEGYPNLAVQEILLDGLDKGDLDAIKTRLTVILTLSHPGVLKHHQVVEDEGLIYVVTDRHDRTLERLLTEHKRRKIPVSAGVILSVMKQLAAALAYLHGLSGVGANGLVHCDLRPANVLISADGERFVIADFGLCRNTLWSESTIAGMAVYMAPEMLLHNEPSPASDVWSLGVILYEMATLRRPDFLKGKDPKDVFVDRWRPDLSSVTDGFIKSVLERIFVLEPEERLTARELHETLTAADIPVGELGAQYAMLKYECGSLKAALNSANARIATLEAALDARSTEMVSQSTETASLKDALEDQCKEHLAMIKALENRFTEFSGGMNTSSSQINLSALPQLIRAAHTNDMETVRMLVSEGIGIGQRDEQGMTALMHAAQQGHVGPVRLLVERGNGLQDRNGWTALMHAAHNGHPGAARILAPYEYWRRDNNGRTALMMATQQGSLEVVKLLLDHEKGLKDKQHHNALYHALENGHLGVAEMIIPYEDPTDEKGVTALMRAAARGDTGMVRLLIPVQKGIKDSNGDTAFMHALKNQHADIALLLREHEAPSWTPLMCAAFTGDVTMVRRHFHERDVKNSDGETALVIAARKGYREIVELLDPTDENGVTALMRAVDRNDLMAVKALLPLQGGQKATGDVRIGKLIIYGGTALMIAAARGHTRIVELLVEKEGGMQTSYGSTALIRAAENGHTDCVRLLVKKEGGVQNKYGWTALMSAAQNGYTRIVEVLLEKEGGMQRSDGQTALMSATQYGHTDCTRILLEKEGGMQNNGGSTALMFAVRYGHLECVKLLLEKEKNIDRRKLLNTAEGNEEILAILSK
ncbi:Kinase, NEK [Giardia duodenalis]|uniref:Kinase, NEK n=1 Tax=Giardia intestinalis (strain ATCC 50803 / WB clone C6) TaxID=184922 RepID=A8B4R2_GIAIC|nr:Kinase, NEK [Giardia intestinalis]KAE8303743.1 Kinase, NEK [Giardia intestinalis]|eukprot:XP_001709670.1 Kinase, NEK [Giardia lamblia ATCC 50803]